MFGYRVPAPNEALLISGRKQRGADALQFKIVTGHGAFVVPVFPRASRLTLAMQEAEVEEDCYTQQGLTLAVRAVVAFKVGDDHESIAAAARRFQGDQSQMSILVGRIFSGHLRSIIGSMTVEAGVEDLVVMKTTRSAFSGFPRDTYTTLPETKDRILATTFSATWDFSKKPANYSTANDAILAVMGGK